MSLCSGDFFGEVPGGGDLYVLSRILHDWPDDAATHILRRCREAMSENAVLCILEQVAPAVEDRHAETAADLAIKDLNMLVLVGGQERTRNEYAALLVSADLDLRAVHHGETCDVLVAEANPARRA